ncbi:hypothetical protein CAV_0727 [Campylobacter avium LMG 24591]|uniref:Uncharacterized protein n=1 Tax=Campylobacter avium LMG 24591 TaxID=522484 RepID=A0A222MWG4_9BACT|nr:hypothetical protein [Campylobacter avium]ASQ30394.1 hypothetical protein CAV_0727 [Campylobacter avium LMG 24591]OYD79492.1 hypothetical protein CAV8706_0731 [Campylobacter avium]
MLKKAYEKVKNPEKLRYEKVLSLYKKLSSLDLKQKDSLNEFMSLSKEILNLLNKKDLRV